MVYDSKLFNIDPFYDDYDEDKKFLRILYRPGFGLQARELTQMQTILQSQIQRFGDHIFENGSKVVGCEISDQDVKFVRISNLTGSTSVTAAFDGNIIFNHTGTTAQTAKIVAALPGITNDDYGILFYQELSGATGDPGATSYDGTGFTHGTTIKATASNDNTTSLLFTITGPAGAVGPTITGTSIGTAKIVNVNQGIRYVDGFFVKSSQQSLPVNLKDTDGIRVFNDLTTKVGFNINRSTVSSTEDSTLTDPANGYYNYAAPGADRYKIDLVLGNVSFDPSSTATTGNEANFIETYRLVNDNVTKKEKYPDYSFLLDTLARRTYDESGNYTIRPFSLDFTGSNVGAAATSLTASLGAGKGYVLGYEIETIAPTNITVNKALNTGDLADDTPLETNMGNYVIAQFPFGTEGHTQGVFGESFDIEKQPLVILATGDNLQGPASSTGGCGTARIRQIDTEDSSANTFKVYLYDINMKSTSDGGTTAGFNDVQNIYREGAGATFPMFSLTADRVGNLNDPDLNTLLFEVDNVDKMNNIDDLDIFFKRARYFTNFSSGTKTFSRSDFGLNASGTDVIFAGSSSFSTIPNSSATVVFNREGKILPGQAKTKSSASQIEIDLTDNSITSAYVVANFRMQSTSPIREKAVTTKTITNQRIEGLTFSGQEMFQFLDGDVDVFEIVSITGQTGGNTPTGEDVDMTSFFDLDTGQRDNMYDFSRIVLKNEHQDTGVTAVDVTYKLFTRSGNEGPFIVNSYTPGISSSAIPEFVSPNTGKTTPLANVVDFRPDRDRSGLNFLTSPGNTSSGVSGSAADAKQFMPTRGIQDSKVEGSFFLPRIDKIVLSKDRNFRVVEGVASVNPQEPAELPDAMTLYTLRVNADTRGVDDVVPTKIENRRYTMRDIGDIERRVENLEFFTKLSLDEEDALNISITGDNNVEKFKNGVLVDSFEGHSVGDVSNQFYRASVDFENGELRPRFNSKSIGLTADSTFTAGITNSTAGGSNPSGLLTLDYTTEKYINQIFANTTIDPNPSNVYNFIGTMSIDPPSDSWYDDSVRPVVLANSEDQNDAWIADSNSSGFGTRWLDWASTWFGRSTVSQAYRDFDFSGFEDLSRKAKRRRVGKFIQSLLSRKRRRAKSRIKRSKPKTILTKINDKIVEQDVVRFIRSKTLNITAKGLRPNIRVYPFFDSIDVSTSCTPSGGSLGDAIKTDSDGTITLTFAIPAGTFKDGDKLFRLIDDSSNTAANSTTVAEAIYRVSGNQQEQNSGLLSTRSSSFQRETVKDERIFEDAKARDITRLGLNDLLAQQFSVSSYAYPSGLFVKSVDLFVSAKDATLPITVQIRPLTNGYPNPSKFLPFATSTVTAANVSTTSTMDPDTPTTFEFDSPVYLTPGDYCITVQTNGSEYKLWVGEEGEVRTGTTSDVISRAPYVGPIFESQNASAREANKTKFLAFRINKCKFTGKDQSAGNRLLTLKTLDSSGEYGTTDISVHEYHLDVGELTVPGTNITYQQQSRRTSGGSLVSLEDTEVNETLKFFDRKRRVVRPGSAGDFVLKATLSSDNDDISPIIDPSKVNIITIENDINAQQDKISFENFATPNGITNSELPAMRYISRQVNLEPGFESTEFTLRLEQQRPNTTSNIFAFLRVQGDDETNFEDKPFISLNAATAQSTTVQGEDEFISVDYTLTAGAITGSESPYSKFAVKIVMYDDNTFANVPKIRNMIAIAHGEV